MLTAVQRSSPIKRGVEDGGMLHRRTIHITDVLPWITGRRVVRVAGKIQYETGHIEETLVDMRLEFEGGLCASLLCIKACDENQDEVTVYADTQSYRLERDRLYTITRRDGWQRVENLPEYGNSSDHFVEAIKGNRSAPDAPFADPHSEDGLQAQRVVFAMHKAAQTGRVVDV
jgi:predicted dehydrogenase